MTATEAAKQLRQMAASIKGPIKTGVNWACKAARTQAIKEYEGTSFGRNLLASRTGGAGAARGDNRGLRAQIRVSFVREVSPAIFEGGLWLTGLAAMMEKGGRTKQHLIFAKRARAVGGRAFTGLGFVLRDGRFFKGLSVRHPGGPVRGISAARAALERARPKMRGYIDAALQRNVQKLGLS